MGGRRRGSAWRIDVAEPHIRIHRCAGAWIVAALVAVVLVSCSEEPRNPRGVVRNMVHAHGGPHAIERLRNFAGKGFIRDLSDTVVAKSFPFDVYRSGLRYKHRLMRAPGGAISDIIVLCHDGEETFEWTNRGGRRDVPPMEIGALQYRFPMVLSWVREEGRSPELLPHASADREIRLRYAEGDLILTIAVDRRSWLLGGVEIRSAADTAFQYEEHYGAYMDLEGIPFPERFTASYRNEPLYDYLLSVVELRGEMPDSLFAITGADTAAFAR